MTPSGETLWLDSWERRREVWIGHAVDPCSTLRYFQLFSQLRSLRGYVVTLNYWIGVIFAMSSLFDG